MFLKNQSQAERAQREEGPDQGVGGGYRVAQEKMCQTRKSLTTHLVIYSVRLVFLSLLVM